MWLEVTKEEYDLFEEAYLGKRVFPLRFGDVVDIEARVCGLQWMNLGNNLYSYKVEFEVVRRLPEGKYL